MKWLSLMYATYDEWVEIEFSRMQMQAGRGLLKKIFKKQQTKTFIVFVPFLIMATATVCRNDMYCANAQKRLEQLSPSFGI